MLSIRRDPIVRFFSRSLVKVAFVRCRSLSFRYFRHLLTLFAHLTQSLSSTAKSWVPSVTGKRERDHIRGAESAVISKNFPKRRLFSPSNIPKTYLQIKIFPQAALVQTGIFCISGSYSHSYFNLQIFHWKLFLVMESATFCQIMFQ